MISTLLIALTVALSQAEAQAQENRQDEVARLAVESQVPLPNGNDVWTVRVTRYGGFAGVWITATLTSEGNLDCISCANTPVSRKLTTQEFLAVTNSFTPQTLAANPAVVVPKSGEATSIPVSVCMDCFVTRVMVQHRDSAGKVEFYMASWDDITTASAPAELVKLANGVVSALKSPTK